MVKCRSCGGVYEPIQSDGSEYYHRCPPLSAAELAAAVDAGAVTLPKGETADDAIQHRVYERHNLRDENLQATRGAAAKQIVAAGAGVDELEAVRVDAPVVVDMTDVEVPLP